MHCQRGLWRMRRRLTQAEADACNFCAGPVPRPTATYDLGALLGRFSCGISGSYPVTVPHTGFASNLTLFLAAFVFVGLDFDGVASAF